MEQECYSRFTGACADWLCAHAPLVALVQHTAESPHIFFTSGADDTVLPSLQLKLGETLPWLPDNDELLESFVFCEAYAESRVAALNIIGAVRVCAKQDGVNDASFTKSYGGLGKDIRTLGIRFHGVTGRARKSRSGQQTDALLPNAYVADGLLCVRWTETTL